MAAASTVMALPRRMVKSLRKVFLFVVTSYPWNSTRDRKKETGAWLLCIKRMSFLAFLAKLVNVRYSFQLYQEISELLAEKSVGNWRIEYVMLLVT
jgi:hypothetical protein